MLMGRNYCHPRWNDRGIDYFLHWEASWEVDVQSISSLNLLLLMSSQLMQNHAPNAINITSLSWLYVILVCNSISPAKIRNNFDICKSQVQFLMCLKSLVLIFSEIYAILLTCLEMFVNISIQKNSPNSHGTGWGEVITTISKALTKLFLRSINYFIHQFSS